MFDHIFLYGTLLPELAPTELRGVLRRMQRVGEAFVAGRLYDLGDFPGALLAGRPDSTIRGEVFAFSDSSLLDLMDSYEGFHPGAPKRSLFARQKVSVAMPQTSQVINCWIYVYNRNPGNARIIPGGDYSEYVRARRLGKYTL